MKIFCLLFLVILLQSCKIKNDPVSEVMSLAGANKVELEKVIIHYKSTGENEKLKATYFLIGNMKEKFSLDDPSLNKYFKIYEDILHIYLSGIKDYKALDSIVLFKIDSIDTEYGPLKLDKLRRIHDIDTITADFLIENIDLAFEAWRTKPWAKHVNFNQFCEYILPYRVHYEPLQNWRKYLKAEYDIFMDSLKNPNDPKEIARKVNDYIFKEWKFLDNFSKYPYYPGIKSIDHYKGGICEQHYLLVTAVLRSIGVPCAIDFTPQWRHWGGKHSWLVILDTTGKITSFNPGDPMSEPFFQNTVPIGIRNTTKVYRQTFAIQQSNPEEFYSKQYFVPSLFEDNLIYDVTEEYTYPKSNISFPLNKEINNKVIYLTAFNYGMNREVVAWTTGKNSTATFKSVGFPAFYLPIYYENGNEIPAGNLLFLDKNGQHSLVVDTLKKQTVKLTRKYPLGWYMLNYCCDLIGARIQGANSPDFKNASDLYIIQDTIGYYFEQPLINSKSFRYLRFLAPQKGLLNLSEIEFYAQNEDNKEVKLSGKIIGVGKTLKGHMTDAFDNNTNTSYSSDTASWIGLDLGKPKQVNKFRYLARSDLNHIEVGDIYELFYFFNNEWNSLGRQLAENNYVIFKHVPEGALLLLKDISEGKEERIFTYKNDKQIWW
jgi:hypothetical protein